VDIAVGFVPVNGFKYVIVFLDAFSTYAVLVEMKTREASEILQAFRKHVICRFGLPKVLYGDNEPGLLSNQMKDFCESNGIEIKTTSPHSPFSNGVCERLVGLCKNDIRLLTKQTGQNWVDCLHLVNVGLNMRPLKSSGFTPEQLMFGSELESNNFLQSKVKHSSIKEYMNNLQSKIAEIHKSYNETREKFKNSKRPQK